MHQIDELFLCEPELKACRICLATDVKLFSLHLLRLFETFEEVTGISISKTDGLPQHICSICYTLLNKAAAFRSKCRNIHVFLQDNRLQFHTVTMDYLKSLDTRHLKLPLIKTEIQIIDVLEDNKDVIIKNESHLQLQEENDLTYDSCDDIPIADLLYEADESKIANDCDAIKKDETRNKKHKRNRDKTMNMDTEQIKEFLTRSQEKTKNDFKKLFYKYIIEKYIDKTRPRNLERIDINDELDIDLVKSENIDSEFNISCENQDNPNKETFYDYIKEKYVNKQTKEVKVADVIRYRMRKLKNNKKYKSKEQLETFAEMYNFNIIPLSREEQILEIQARKESKKFKMSPFQCQLCFRGFRLESAYSCHMAAHDPSSGNHICDICQVRFPLRGKLLKHLLNHKMKFICKLCNRISRNSTEAKEHYKSHAGVKYECEYCEKIFRRYASRVNHIRIHHGNTSCDICYEAFAGPVGLVAHKSKAHREVFKCQNCDVSFNDMNALLRHTASLSVACGPNSRPCAKCGENFSGEEQLTDHVLQSHAKKSQDKKLKRKQKSKHSAGPELDGPTDGPDEKWDPLDKKSKKRFMCEMCAVTTFTSKAALRYHQRIHTGERPYECSMCPKRFRLKELLQMHMRTHTGDRPYKCSLCPKSFKSYAANYRHQLVHTKERRHRCPLCQKSFQTSTCVKLHVRSVHMKLPAPPRVRNRHRLVQ